MDSSFTSVVVHLILSIEHATEAPRVREDEELAHEDGQVGRVALHVVRLAGVAAKYIRMLKQ